MGGAASIINSFWSGRFWSSTKILPVSMFGFTLTSSAQAKKLNISKLTTVFDFIPNSPNFFNISRFFIKALLKTLDACTIKAQTLVFVASPIDSYVVRQNLCSDFYSRVWVLKLVTCVFSLSGLRSTSVFRYDLGQTACIHTAYYVWVKTALHIYHRGQ